MPFEIHGHKLMDMTFKKTIRVDSFLAAELSADTQRWAIPDRRFAPPLAVFPRKGDSSRQRIPPHSCSRASN
jgi:hypothetical protein